MSNTVKCLICTNSVSPFISFGKMPIANGFVTQSQVKDEYFFELKVGFCEKCSMVQLTELVDDKKMFHENYAYFSSISTRMAEHFRQFALHVQNDFGFDLKKDGFVVELGSNDGIMLKNFAEQGIRHVGVEPSANVAAEARKKGVNTISEFFGKEAASKLVKEYGKADAILAANVMCHIASIHSVFDGAQLLLKDQGVFSFEDPYLCDILEKTSYDQIYDEHVFYFSAHSVSNLAKMHGLELVDLEPQTTHGGSMRYVLALEGRRPVSPRVAEIKRKEVQAGILKAETFDRFRDNVNESKKELVGLLKSLRAEGRRVAGYGATSKSTTVLNFCGIGPELIDFISDTTPTKVGKLTPGTHIPVVPYSDFTSKQPDFAVLFAWNHAEEIMAKEKGFTTQNKKFIVYVPKVQVL
jgi:methylation protein EvaC